MSQRNAARLPLMLGFLLLAVGPVSAQDTAAEKLRRAVASFGDSTHLRLFAPGVMVSDGHFLGLEGDSVRVADADAVFAIGLDEIESLAMEGSKWLTVGAQTAAVTAVAGAVAGYFFGVKDCTELQGCDAEALGRSLRWGLGFGLAGGLGGGLAGSRIRGWRAVFP